MHDAAFYIQLLLSGVTVGSLYALIAIGYTMVYGILRLINFAHGDICLLYTSYIDPFQGAVMANFANKEKGSVNCALIIESGDDYSAGFGNYFQKEMERLGGKATVLEFQKGEADFSTMMATIKSAGYDGIFAPVSIETAAMIISQARDSGVTCPIMAGDTWDDISIAQRTGDKATDLSLIHI